MIKGIKCLIIICVGVYLVFRILYSPNVLLPMSVSSDDYKSLFKGTDNVLDVKYSFGNLKNSICIYDINKEYRCWVWKFNEYSVVPEFNMECISDTLIVDNYVENYYGNDPMLGTFNRMGSYSNSNLTVRVNCLSSITRVIENKEYLSLYGVIDEVGVFNEDKCDLKFKYDRGTKSRIVFYKDGVDFYMLMLYGISGNVLEEGQSILNNFEE